jgi:glycosyltransferase involved in cell wall biosynthesis
MGLTSRESMTARTRSVSSSHISIIIPVYNEEAVLPELRKRLRSTFESLSGEFEVIFVDDGSSDNSAAMIDQMHLEDPRFCALHLSRNFGHQAAVTAGLDYARGDVACVMDADLQDPPEVLPALLREWETGSDVVYGVRRNRKESRLKVQLYRVFYRLLSSLSAIPMPLDSGDFCVITREVLDELNRLPEKERFVRGLRAWVGFRQVGVDYDRESRHAGESKYRFLALVRLAVNGIVSFSDKPLIYVMLFGAVISALSFLYGSYLVLYRVIFGGVITGYASMMGGLLFLSGVQLLSLGLVGIYISKIFQEVKARPTYVVGSLCGLERPFEGASPAPSEAQPASATRFVEGGTRIRSNTHDE